MKENDNVSDRIKYMIIDYLQGSASEEEIRSLKKWLLESDLHRELFTQLKASWIMSDRLKKENRFDDNKMWKTLQKDLISGNVVPVHKSTPKINIQRIIRIAASWLLIFLAGVSVSSLFTKKEFKLEPSTTTIFSPLGSRSRVMLPDGTAVWLNAGSSLEYGNNFNIQTREVTLVGEGFFDVKTNPDKPFVVSAGDITIKALGTSFNVKAYPEENKVIATLVKGKITIEGKDEQLKPFAITLQPKQNVTYYSDSRLITSDELKIAAGQHIGRDVKTAAPQILPTIPVIKDQNVKTELYTSWKDPRWIIEGEKLGNLSVMLERRYNVAINIDSEELKTYRFSGTIENETLEQVFQILRLTLPVDYMIDTGRVTVKMDKKLRERYKPAYN